MEVAAGRFGLGDFLALLTASLYVSGEKDRSCCGDSGENEGKDVSDLSDAATEDAELEGCVFNFLDLDFARTEWPLLLLAEAVES